MTINKTIDRIGAYGEQIETQVEKLADVAPPAVKTVSEIGPHPNSPDLLMAVFVDQLSGAAERLKAVQEACRPEPLFDSVKNSKASEEVIDVTEYKQVLPTDGS